MKRNLMIGLAAIIIIIVVIAAGAIISLGNQENSNYTPKVGDFIKYEESFNNTQHTGNVTYEILGVNSTEVFLKQTDDVSITYLNMTENKTFFALDVNQHPAYYNLTNLGKETIDTKWGMRSTEHYSLSALNMHEDLWMRNGVLVKLEWRTALMTVTAVMVDTNISQITG